ncbi:pyridoxal-dependent decarboxylase [Leisingera daeponensis]|uniref:pyridoxal-dependent decarboxylase n=1 Tax=Leisingera daeponensis TaxID=405746 RepID=UPI0003F97120
MSTDLIERVPCDRQGALRLECLPDLDPRTIVVAQAGNVNSGSFDPIAAICARAQTSGAWVHVDGVFGLWAAASRSRRHLLEGYEAADSWVVDGH